MSETLNVDNDPVSVSLATPDDANPTVWVNHGVTVDATPSTGPSGLGGMNCSVDSGAAQNYPAGGLIVNGDGVRTVSCTAWNNAVDPQGNHNSGTSSVTVHIDEAPPSMSLEPVNPNDPTGVVVDTSDSESGVAGGSIEMAPAGTGKLDGSAHDLHREPTRSSFRRRRAARRVHLQRSILRQRRQLRLNRSDGHAAGPDSGHLGGECRASPRYAMRQSRRQARMLLHRRREVGASGSARLDWLGRLVSDSHRTAQLLRLRASLVPARLAAGGALTDGSSGSGALSVSHPDPQASIAKTTMRQAGEAAEGAAVRPRRGSRRRRASPLAGQ